MAIGKKQLSMIVDNCFKYHGATETAEMLDKIKSLGYKYSTIGAITASVFDMHIPGDKKLIVHEAEEQVVRIENSMQEACFPMRDVTKKSSRFGKTPQTRLRANSKRS